MSNDPNRRDDGTYRPASEVAEIVAELESNPQRDGKGRWVEGNTVALKHGRRAERDGALWKKLEPLKAELAEQMRDDLGIADAELAVTLEGVIDGYLEARILRQSLFARMARLGGPVTNKGHKRALFDAWLSALDREHRLARDLGFEREPRYVNGDGERSSSFTLEIQNAGKR